MRRLLVALVLGACTLLPGAQASPARTATRPAATAAAPPSALPPLLSPLVSLADGTRVVSIPDCDARSAGGLPPACELLTSAVDRGVFVGILRRHQAGQITFEARAIDLASGQLRVLKAPGIAGLAIEDVRDDVVILSETIDTGPAQAHVRLFRIAWRDPARTETLDEIDIDGLAGGDAWNPWPAAKTNGREVVWLRAGLFAPHELVLLGADGKRRTVQRADGPQWFDLDDVGRVVVATIGPRQDTQDLVLYESGRARALGSRAVDAGGFVMSFGDWVGWARGYGTARPPEEIELISLTGAAARAARAAPSCVIVGRTGREVVTVCPAGARLLDVASGVARDGPPSRVVLAFRRGLLWRTSADLGANPEVWRITLL